MKRILVLMALLAGFAWAAIGEEASAYLLGLAPYEATEVSADTYEVGSFTLTLEERGGVLYRVHGEGLLDEDGIAVAARAIGGATIYGEGIAEPVRDFLREHAAQLSGEGRVPLAVEEYTLELEVTGEAPQELSFSIMLSEVPEHVLPLGRHAIGPEDASIVIREFSDFQCPFCARFAQDTLPLLKDQLLARGDVRFEYHHFPLNSIHPNAQPAAEAAECVTAANDPEAFWTYHDALFERMQAWASLGDPYPYFVRLARDVGLSAEGVAECLANRDFADDVDEATFIAAGVLRLRGTPSVFVNGYRVGNPGDIGQYLRLVELIERFSQAE